MGTHLQKVCHHWHRENYHKPHSVPHPWLGLELLSLGVTLMTLPDHRSTHDSAFFLLCLTPYAAAMRTVLPQALLVPVPGVHPPHSSHAHSIQAFQSGLLKKPSRTISSQTGLPTPICLLIAIFLTTLFMTGGNYLTHCVLSVSPLSMEILIV